MTSDAVFFRLVASIAAKLPRMKILAWVLGLLALVSTVGVSANWVHDRKQARMAASSRDTFASLASTDEFSHRLKRQVDASELEDDERRLQNADTAFTIAVMRGVGIAQARTSVIRYRELVMLDKALVQANRQQDELSEDPSVRSDHEREEASRESFAVYSAGVHRDEHLAYAIGALWVAFGFAWALAARG